MQSELLKLLLFTDNERITKKRKKRSAKAEAEKEKAKDQLALNHAQDKLRRAEERLESLLRSMEHHRQQAEHNGGSIPTHDIELTIRELMD